MYYTVNDLCDEAYFKPLMANKEAILKEILGINDKKENKTMINKFKESLNAKEKDIYNRAYNEGWDDKSRLDGFIKGSSIPRIKKVIFNDPATIVFWADGTKTVAKAHGDDKFNKEVGLTVCIAKKALGNRSNFDKAFKKWIKED